MTDQPPAPSRPSSRHTPTAPTAPTAAVTPSAAPAQPATPRPATGLVRYALIAVAWICVLLGLIGAVVPGMPTTVFILAAAWAAVRSSARLHHWLYAHAVFGPLLRNWDAGGQVSRRSKWAASASMTLSAAVMLYVAHSRWALVLTLSVMGCVLLWLWLRPEPQVPETPETPETTESRDPDSES